MWDLAFNATNCQVMHFARENPKLVMNGCTLGETTQERDLGVIIDKDLKFHVYTAAAVKKANQLLGIIKRSYCTRDADTVSTLYKVMVRPLLEYGNVIWGPHYRMDMKSRISSKKGHKADTGAARNDLPRAVEGIETSIFSLSSSSG